MLSVDDHYSPLLSRFFVTSGRQVHRSVVLDLPPTPDGLDSNEIGQAELRRRLGQRLRGPNHIARRLSMEARSNVPTDQTTDLEPVLDLAVVTIGESPQSNDETPTYTCTDGK